MQCPTDGTTLTMSERSGIEIDYCPECRGVWLDRGELDKIIERSLTQGAARAGTCGPAGRLRAGARPAPAALQRALPGRPAGLPPRKKKESWLSELFD